MPNASMLLIVDDCAEDREVYRRYLLKDSHQSYQIIEADAAEDGLALCRNGLCDAILLDFQLPDMDGLEFLDRLKFYHSETPVIMLTAYGDEEVAVQAMKRGAQDYLVKRHLKPDILQLAVRNVIKQAHLQRQLSKNQEHQRLIATIALRIRQSLDLQQTLDTAVTEVRQLLKCDRVVVYQLEPNRSGKIVAESVASNWPPTLGYLISDLDFQLGGGEDTCQKDQRTIDNIYQAGLSQGHLDLLDHFAVKANLATPIILTSAGESTPKLWGLLAAHQCSGVRRWQADEVEILEALSVQLAIAIQQAELLAQTQTALEKEKELNSFKSQIIATVSHEYQSPLAAILAAASTLTTHRSHLNQATQQRFLKIVEQKAKHMSNLVNDMLVVNQAELNKTQFKPVPLDLAQFLSELIQEQQTVCDRHDLMFSVTGNVKGFMGDRGILQQVFFNLLSNAIKYSPDGGAVKIRLIGEASQVICRIQDSGIGISLEDQRRLFQSFSRGSNVGAIAGTGLGLSIVKTCVELHGGDISLTSQVNQGTRVTVSLPKRHTPANDFSNTNKS